MIRARQHGHRGWIFLVLILSQLMSRLSLFAQNPSLEQQVAGIQESLARSKAELVQYTWQQQVTLTVKEKVKAQELFQVQFGTDGSIQRMPLDLPGESSSSAKTKGMGEWMSEKKERALYMYALDLRELAESYAQADPDLLRSAYQHGDVASAPAESDAMQLLVRNYVKSGDAATFVFDPNDSELQNLDVTSYLATIREPVLVHARFSRSTDVPNHIEELTVVSRKKNVSLCIRNLHYQRRRSEVTP